MVEFKNRSVFFLLVIIVYPVMLFSQQNPIIMEAVQDFPELALNGFVPATKKKGKNVLSVNAVQYKGVFAAARGIFKGESGRYHIKINTLKEFDGESTYRIRVNGKLIGTYQNPRTDESGDFTPSDTTFLNISVEKNAKIRVEFNSHTNGLVPEKGGTAYARGRWSSLIFEPLH